MRAYERLLKYAAVRTPSDEESQNVPSSSCQFELAQDLIRDFINIGLPNARTDETCYVYAHIPATEGFEDRPRLGFIAHLDTVSDYCSRKIVPVVTENYSGHDLPLGGSQNRVLSPEMFPHLRDMQGQTLITSNGDTILGADDKAGIAEIMTMAEQILADNIPHGPISIAFTPDEEIGMGAEHFDVEKFGADFAYTLDGETEGEIQYENFNAAKAVFEIEGVNVHPGSAKDIMVNASLVGMEINSMLPASEIPRETEGYEGFFHLIHMNGDEAHASLVYLIRDHDGESFQKRLDLLRNISGQMNLKWGFGTVSLNITEEYRNMSEIIQNGNMHLIERAKEACSRVGLTPLILPIRGGTDGARLSYKGLPCPNLGTGGHGFHGPFEHITAESMDAVVSMLLELVKLYADA